MLKKMRFFLSLIAVTTALGVISMGCLPGGGFNLEPCDRGDEGCECDLDEDEDPDGETCSMPPEDDEDELGWAWDDEDEGDEDDLDVDNDIDEDDNDVSLSYRYVLLEDLSTSTSGDSPGSDIDAVAIEKDGEEFFATGVVDFNIGMSGNAYIDPSDAIGAPDSECEKKNFVSLGGQSADGYLMLEFGDTVIESGDSIIVYELGSTVCPDQTDWKNDPTAVSISVSDDRSSFEQISVTGEGQNVVPIP